MKLYKLMTRTGVCVLALLGAVACTNEFGEAGAGLVDQVNFNTSLTTEIDIAAYSIKFDEVQTNGLPTGIVGVYTDPIYGNSTVSALSQVTLSRFDPDFGDNAVLDSVFFTLPYFSSREDTDDDGNSTYVLDSIFSNNGPMRLSIYRSNYFLNSLDPESNFEDAAVYFSDDIVGFQGVEGDLLHVIEEFVPSDEEIRLTGLGELDPNAPDDQEQEVIVTERLAPALRVALDSLYFTNNLLRKEGSEDLLNFNNFVDYFRGIYIKAEPINGNGSYILFDYDEANITMYYTFEEEDDSGDDEGADNENGSIIMNFGGVQLASIDTQFNPGIADDINNADVEDGEEKLYLKGGNGAIALVDLFPDRDNDGVEDQLDILRSCNIIINEANLTFYVNQSEIATFNGDAEPERVFIYNYDDNLALLDGQFDLSNENEGPVGIRTRHLGRLTRETENETSSPGISYKLRLTRHLNNIINNDSTNVKLALSVTQNVVDATAARFRTLGGDVPNEERLLAASVISPEGTILHGNRSADEEKRLKLKIYYTLTEDIDPDSPCGRILGL